MAKVALLIGTTDYEPGLAPLPGAREDVLAMERILHDVKLGGFDKVDVLNNPDPIVMQTAIETLFASCSKQDLALLYLSGHGIKDDNGRLYFATRITRKNAKGDLIKATAVPANFVQGTMSDSRCKRQVVILDCCFSGAFAEGMTAKDDGTVDIETQMGGEGRAVLTSSSATQYSFEDETDKLSVYTRFIVEGIEKGVADADNDGIVSIDELHEYASQKVQEVSPAMKPKIYAVEEGFKIRVARAAVGDPKIRYRKELEHFASRGSISTIGRYTLDALRNELSIPAEVAQQIEAEVLQPYREYQEKLSRYETALKQAVERETPLSQVTVDDLDRYQIVLGLADEDIAHIRDRRLPITTKPKAPEPSLQSAAAAPHPVVKAAAEPVAVQPTESQPLQTRPQTQSPGDNNANRGIKIPVIVGSGLGAIVLVIGLVAILNSGESPQLAVQSDPPPRPADQSDPPPRDNYDPQDNYHDCICNEADGCFDPDIEKTVPYDHEISDIPQDAVEAFKEEGFVCDPVS
ncbi:MAG: caspase family protein [Cyanobacteria bacterium J06635_15]